MPICFQVCASFTRANHTRSLEPLLRVMGVTSVSALQAMRCSTNSSGRRPDTCGMFGCVFHVPSGCSSKVAT